MCSVCQSSMFPTADEMALYDLWFVYYRGKITLDEYYVLRRELLIRVP